MFAVRKLFVYLRRHKNAGDVRLTNYHIYMVNLIDAIQKIAEQNPEGFTVDLTTLKRITKGISVAYIETQDSFGIEGLERVINHALGHDRKVGGWMNEDDGQYY